MAPAYALVLALVVTAPLLAPGYLLLRDAVSTPRSYLSDAALGLIGGRAAGAATGLRRRAGVRPGRRRCGGQGAAGHGLWLAGWGAARLAAAVLPDAGLAGQFVAATIAIWNPYVAERLLAGALESAGRLRLPAVGGDDGAAAAHVDVAPTWAGCAALVFWIALAGLTPTGLMLAATVALVCVFAPGRGRPRWLCAAVGSGRGGAGGAAMAGRAAAVADSLSSTQARGR